MTIQENVSLKPFNTFGVEANAKYFALANNEEELLAVLNQYKNLHRENPQKLPLLFLGGGSNILLTKDFDGLVIKLNLKGISEEMMSEDEV